jgi:4-hydroxy-tetrahydrodipicolinate synthase
LHAAQRFVTATAGTDRGVTNLASANGSRLRPDDLRGRIIPAVLVPFREDGTVHQYGQARYIEYMTGQPIGGVAVWAHTGRGLHLDSDQRSEVLTAWRRGLEGDQFLLAAAGDARREREPDAVIQSTLMMARQAADLGADALLVYPPTGLRGRSDQDALILQYHAVVAEAGLPLLLFYLYEAAGGIEYRSELLGELLSRPEVLGIKVATLDSVMTFQVISDLLRSRYPEKVLVSGEDRFLGYSLMCGAEAALVGMAAACTALQSEFLRSYWDADTDRFLALNALVDDFAQHTFVPPIEGYIRRLLWCLVLEGVIPQDAAHDPWGPQLASAEFRRVQDCLERLAK